MTGRVVRSVLLRVAGVLAVVCVWTAGCEGYLPNHPVVGAVTGVGFDPDGTPVVVVAVCDGSYDLVLVVSGGGEVVASSESEEPRRSDFSAPLFPAVSTGPWVVRVPVRRSAVAGQLSVVAGDRGNRWAARPVDAPRDVLVTVPPDRVVYENPDETGRLSVPRQAFHSAACRS